MSDLKIPENGVSKKLKAGVYILTGITLFALIEFFAKMIHKQNV